MDTTKPSTGERMTIVEEGTEFRGAITSSCGLLVHGRISGELTSPGLTITPTGIVSGKIRVGSLTSQGEIKGELEAEHARLSGKVSDDTVIVAKTLEVKLASEGRMTVTFGETKLEVGDDPRAKASG